jgi:hypothetical protein
MAVRDPGVGRFMSSGDQCKLNNRNGAKIGAAVVKVSSGLGRHVELMREIYAQGTGKR